MQGGNDEIKKIIGLASAATGSGSGNGPHTGANTGMTQQANIYLYRNPHPKNLTFSFTLAIENRSGVNDTLKSVAWNRRIHFRYRTWDLFSNCKGNAVELLKLLPAESKITGGMAPYIVITNVNHELKVTGTHKNTKVVSGSTTTVETEAVIAPLVLLSERCPVEITNVAADKEIEHWKDTWTIAKWNVARHTINMAMAEPGQSYPYGSKACCDRVERLGQVTGGNVWNELISQKTRSISATGTKSFVRALPYNTMYGNNKKFLKVETLPTGYRTQSMVDGVMANRWNQSRVQTYKSSDSLPLFSMAVVPNEDATNVMLEGKTIYQTLSSISFSVIYDSAETTHGSTSSHTNLNARNPYYMPAVSQTITATEAIYLEANVEDVEPEIYT